MSKNIVKLILEPIAFWLSKRELNNLNTDNIEAIIESTKTYQGRGVYRRISMSQKDYEISNLIQKVKGLNPKIILEIGTRKGGTLFCWSKAVNAKKIISIDLYGGIHGGGYHPKRKKLYKSFVKSSRCKMHLLQLDSHKSETLSNVKDIIGDELIDFLFIDGDHTLAGVKKDFELYSPLVNPQNGIIAFHDIVVNKTNQSYSDEIGVPIFWNQVKASYQSESFIQNEKQRSMGIGVLFLNEQN